MQTTRQVANEATGYAGPLTDGHWLYAATLQAGDRLLNVDGIWAEVVGAETLNEPLLAYNLTVEGHHTYFVAANEDAAPVWVHNANCDLPNVNLRAHENAGGHLINRHVGKTDQQLVDRANGIGERAPRGGASSYASIGDAERYTSQVIAARRADIDAFLANPGNRLTATFDLDMGQPTGKWVPNGGTSAVSVTAARVVIKLDPSLPTGYRIVTGHPIPQVVN